MEDSLTSTELELEPIKSEGRRIAKAFRRATRSQPIQLDYTLEVLHQKWKTDEIVIPKFQRQFVWKQSQASRLIESFLVGATGPRRILLQRARKSEVSRNRRSATLEERVLLL